MAVKPLTMSPSYLAVVHGIRELHRLCAAGNDESPEADVVRDACDRPWESLSETERQRVGNLFKEKHRRFKVSCLSPDRPREDSSPTLDRRRLAIAAPNPMLDPNRHVAELHMPRSICPEPADSSVGRVVEVQRESKGLRICDRTRIRNAINSPRGMATIIGGLRPSAIPCNVIELESPCTLIRRILPRFRV